MSSPNRIQAFCEKTGTSQRELAKALGVNQSTICRWARSGGSRLAELALDRYEAQLASTVPAAAEERAASSSVAPPG